MTMDRRKWMLGASSLLMANTLMAQSGSHHGAHHPDLPKAPPSAEPYAKLQGGVPHHLTADQESQRSFNSSAPKGPTGRWVGRAALPIPRSEMAWATEWAGRLHVIGGYGEGRVDRGYHHVYEPKTDQWHLAAPLPRGANHVAVVGQQTVFGQMESYDPASNTWQSHAAMPTPRHAVGAVTIGDWVYVAGGGAVLGGSVQSAVHEAFTLSGV